MYRGVAARGAMLFFMLNSLGKMHAFYQYSLQAFVVRKGGWGREVAPGRADHRLPALPTMRAPSAAGRV